MGSSPVRVYTMAKTFWWKNFKNGWKKLNDMVSQHIDTFCFGSSMKVKFLEQPQTLGQETWLLENPNLRHSFNCFPILSAIPTVASNNLVLGWNSWPSGALLRCSLNWPLIKGVYIYLLMLCWRFANATQVCCINQFVEVGEHEEWAT